MARAISGNVFSVTSILPNKSSHKIFSQIVQYAVLKLQLD